MQDCTLTSIRKESVVLGATNSRGKVLLTLRIGRADLIFSLSTPVPVRRRILTIGKNVVAKRYIVDTEKFGNSFVLEPAPIGSDGYCEAGHHPRLDASRLPEYWITMLVEPAIRCYLQFATISFISIRWALSNILSETFSRIITHQEGSGDGPNSPQFKWKFIRRRIAPPCRSTKQSTSVKSRYDESEGGQTKNLRNKMIECPT